MIELIKIHYHYVSLKFTDLIWNRQSEKKKNQEIIIAILINRSKVNQIQIDEYFLEYFNYAS